MDLDQKLGYSRKDFDNRRGLNSFRKTIIPANPSTPFPLGIIYNRFACQLNIAIVQQSQEAICMLYMQ